MGTETQFRTFQTVKNYEEALGRHGQYVRWTKVLVCPCVKPDTGQPDVHCDLCHGRGEIYKVPGPFHIHQEYGQCNNLGRIYLKQSILVAETAFVTQGTLIWPIHGTQPSDNSYIQLAEPYPKSYQRLTIDYKFNPVNSITDENSTVLGTNTLRLDGSGFIDRGTQYYGSVIAVTRVYNVTKNETYTVVLAQKEFVYLSAMGAWVSGDVLEVDYTYIKPFNFMLHSISQKRRYAEGYVIDQADATLVTPYWAEITPNDLVTGLANTLSGYAILNPNLAGGNDVINDVFDLAVITYIIDSQGVEYVPGVDVELYGRNELKWLSAKPTSNYTVHYGYHPTFAGLNTYDTARTSENKSFVNRINVMLRDRMTKEFSH